MAPSCLLIRCPRLPETGVGAWSRLAGSWTSLGRLYLFGDVPSLPLFAALISSRLSWPLGLPWHWFEVFAFSGDRQSRIRRIEDCCNTVQWGKCLTAAGSSLPKSAWLRRYRSHIRSDMATRPQGDWAWRWRRPRVSQKETDQWRKCLNMAAAIFPWLMALLPRLRRNGLCSCVMRGWGPAYLHPMDSSGPQDSIFLITRWLWIGWFPAPFIPRDCRSFGMTFPTIFSPC